MTVEKILEEITFIEGILCDNETAHAREDALYTDVLKAIAWGCKDPDKLAEAALKTKKLDFDRWCA